MTVNTGKFVLGSLVVLVVGLGTGLVAYFGGLPTGAFARQAGPQELSYVPANAAVVAFADVREVMNSELRQKLRAVLPPDGKGREEFKAKTGIDVEADIDHVLACMLPGGDGREGGFAVLTGRFDNVRLEALAREHNAEVTDYKGVRIIQLAETSENAEPADPAEAPDEAPPSPEHRHRGHMRPALAFISPGVIMFGEPASIRQAIDTHATGQNVTGNDEVMNLIKDLDGKANAWAVGRFDVLASRAKLPAQVSSQMPAVTWFAVAGHINGGLNGSLRAEARDEQAAQNLRDVVNGFLALGRLQAGNKPEIQSLMQSVTLGGTGKTVELSFTLPNELLDMIPAMQEHHRGQKALE